MTVAPRPSRVRSQEHVVEFYEAESSLIQSILHLAVEGLREGEGVIVIATADHQHDLRKGLATSPGFDVSNASMVSRLRLLDAEQTLERVLVNGEPDSERFEGVIGRALDQMARFASRIRMYGEMVSVLWAQGHRQAAKDLEALWNRFARTRIFSLHCSYPLSGFAGDTGEDFRTICYCHTRVICPEGVRPDADDLSRESIACQLRASPLHSEGHKRPASALSESLEIPDEGLHEVGFEGKILWASPSQLAMLGYSAEEYIGQPMQKFHVNSEAAVDVLNRLKRGETIRDYPVTLRRRNGDTLNALVNSGGRSEKGRYIHTRTYIPDLSSLHDGQKVQGLLAAIVDSSDDAIISKTLDGIIRSWNAGAERLFEYTAEEAIGQSILLIIPPELHEEEQTIQRRLRSGERIRHYETVRVAKSGRRIDISLTISPLRDATGQVIGASKIARDITERKRFEAELREADRRKDEFLAMLGHELRNPLGPIRNAAALIELVSQDQPQLKEATDIIERQVRHMGRIIDDLLDVTRISRGMIKLVTEPIDFRRLVLQVVNDFRPLIESNGITLNTEIVADELWVNGDSVRLSQVIGNLLHNAYKFCDRGATITVRLLWLKTLGEAKLSIQDTGMGISAEMLPRLFLPFSQDEKSLDRSRGGLGLGLALVHGLIDLHGGSVEAASPGPGQGAIFTVRLPLILAPEQRPAPRRLDDRATKSLSILVIDDQRDAVRTLERLLSRLGHNVMTAVNGEEGIRIVHETAPQVVFSDIGLPGMSGYEVARAIRKLESDHTPLLVAVTGYGRDEDMQQAFAAGFDRHLVKPVSLSDLTRLLNSV